MDVLYNQSKIDDQRDPKALSNGDVLCNLSFTDKG